MRKILLTILSLLAVIGFSTISVFAQAGCCSWHGGESYCSGGRWVCMDGTYSPTCTCGGGYQAPVYNYPTPTPSCPFNSYYSGGSCQCYSGYVASGGSCISIQQYCWNNYGYESTTDYAGGCKCLSGYVMSGGKCISGNTWCQNNDGLMSYYNSLDGKCYCLSGYTFNGSQCVYNTPMYAPPVVHYPTNTPTPYPTNTPVPTAMPTLVLTNTPTPTPSVEGVSTSSSKKVVLPLVAPVRTETPFIEQWITSFLRFFHLR